ncbi:hypothetical protein ACWDG1_37840 [Streptomyces sp. NPDC001177]
MEKVAQLHRKVRRQRLDHAHKTALGLVRVHDFIAHADIKIRNMSKAPAPKPEPGRARRAPSCPRGRSRSRAQQVDQGLPDGGCS